MSEVVKYYKHKDYGDILKMVDNKQYLYMNRSHTWEYIIDLHNNMPINISKYWIEITKEEAFLELL